MSTRIIRNRYLPKPITKPTSLYDFMKMIIKLMRAEPARVDQGDWLRTGADAVCEIPDRRSMPVCGDPYCTTCTETKFKEVAPACGTVGCTAGWAAVLLGHARWPDSETIADQLGLSFIDSGIEARLFDAAGYNNDVTAPAGTAKHVQQVTGGINAFLEDYEEETKRMLVFPKGKVK